MSLLSDRPFRKLYLFLPLNMLVNSRALISNFDFSLAFLLCWELSTFSLYFWLSFGTLLLQLLSSLHQAIYVSGIRLTFHHLKSWNIIFDIIRQVGHFLIFFFVLLFSFYKININWLLWNALWCYLYAILIINFFIQPLIAL